MAEFEAQMAEEDKGTRKDLELLGTTLSLGDSSGIETITASYSEFDKTRTRIINLSRENTDLHSAANATRCCSPRKESSPNNVKVFSLTP